MLFLLAAFLVPLSGLDPTCHGYPTEVEAVEVALTAAASLSTTKEYAGVVYKSSDGVYCYTQPVTSGARDGFAIRVDFPPGAELAALYHTHPKGLDSEQFSRDDIDFAHAVKKRSYIMSIASGHIRLYDPAVDPQLGSEISLHPSRGILGKLLK